MGCGGHGPWQRDTTYGNGDRVMKLRFLIVMKGFAGEEHLQRRGIASFDHATRSYLN